MNGLILLDKPQGFTSFKAVAALRRIYGVKRAGHTGTLDPMATGVLPIFLGRATRLCSLVLESDKRYTATVRLGLTTDSLDITGEVISSSDVSVTDEQLNEALKHFTCEYDQVPPMFSAIKKDGVRLYDLARQGVDVERQPRRVSIKEINLLWRKGNDFCVDVLCSKGTYIRSLADDLGKHLGCGAVLTELRRTKTAQFEIFECATLEEIEKNPSKYLRSAEKAVEYLNKVNISSNQAKRFLNGAALDVNRVSFAQNPKNNEIFRVSCEEEFLGLGEYDSQKNELSVKFIIKE